jgi:DNA-binding beta-propeller fold protein YncE
MVWNRKETKMRITFSVVLATAALLGTAALIFAANRPGADLRHQFTDHAASHAASSVSSFVNWESPHVSPIDMTPDGETLLVVNTADNRLEVFQITEGGLSHAGHLASVPVGLDPVSVRARTNNEAWVVNHISDSINIVNLESMNVVRTLSVGDEPADVVFAGNPQRAFVSLALPGVVKVYDPANLSQPPLSITIQGHRPRALETDGTNVYAAIFEAGNNTTIIGRSVVSSSLNPYPGNPNPPPNWGNDFNPPMAVGLPPAPAEGLILRKHDDGTWRDDNALLAGGGADWSAAVTWDLHGHDVAVIDANSLQTTYVTGLLTTNMHLAVNPAGSVAVIGTEALNHVRFEPNLRSTFLRVMAGTFSTGGGTPTLVDLNPHLTYETHWLPPEERALSIGDPRGIAFNAAGNRAYITGMGSNNVIAVDENMNRLAMAEVGAGPTGVIVDDVRGKVYVVNKFEGTVSVLAADSLSELQRIGFYDPTPLAITDGRRHLYDTHHSSGLGHTSCASCHVDGRMDQLAWDLGDPQGQVKPFNQTCNAGMGPGSGQCSDWHPMKGPMTTQTLLGIIGTEPLHWRGDREDLAAFNGAFPGLLGRETELNDDKMQQFTDFIATLRFPPNPHRNTDNSLKTALFNGGNPANGEDAFLSAPLAGPFTCAFCHVPPTGHAPNIISANLLQESQDMKVPQLRNMHDKVGFNHNSQNNNRGFGFAHDGEIDTLISFLSLPVFNFPPGETGAQMKRDIEAFMFSFSTDTHAGVGTQTTVTSPNPPSQQMQLLQLMLAMADAQEVGVVVKGVFNGEQRGFAYMGGGQFQSDRAKEVYTSAQLLAAAGPGSELTVTAVPYGSQIRIGIDRDEDGYFDRDELDAGSDPADPASTPTNPCPHSPGDLNCDGVVNVADLLILFDNWGPCADCTPGACPADLNGDCVVNVADLLILFDNWG